MSHSEKVGIRITHTSDHRRLGVARGADHGLDNVVIAWCRVQDDNETVDSCEDVDH